MKRWPIKERFNPIEKDMKDHQNILFPFIMGKRRGKQIRHENVYLLMKR